MKPSRRCAPAAPRRRISSSWWSPPMTASCRRRSEAINHARAAEVPIIVAINKIDKPQANPNRVRTELLQHEVVVESMGGDTLEVEVSALKGTNLDKLLDIILLQSEVLDLKANPDREASGIVVEAQLDRGRGPVATVLVQRGTLHLGDIFVAGSAWGRVRALVNDKGEQVKDAGPSVPVEVLGSELGAGSGRSIRRRRERGEGARDHRLPRAQAARAAWCCVGPRLARADDEPAQGRQPARNSRSWSRPTCRVRRRLSSRPWRRSATMRSAPASCIMASAASANRMCSWPRRRVP